MKNNKNIQSIAMDITYKCNFSCLHCFNNSGNHNLELEEMTDKEILKICDDIIKLSPVVICLCGGEPLIRKDLVYKIIDKVVKGTNNKTQVNMVTNGYFMTDEIAVNLKKFGISNVQVSIDGKDGYSHNWIRNNENAFQRATEALRILKSKNINTSVSCTPTKKNINEVKEIVALCKYLKVSLFRMQPLMLLGRANYYLIDEILNMKEYMHLVDILEECKYCDENSEINIEWGNPLEHLSDSLVKNFEDNIFININAYGFLAMSPYIPLHVGNLRKYSLLDYINSNYELHLKSSIVRELCSKLKTTENMDISQTDYRIPKNYYERSIYLDWIDNRDKFDLTIDDIVTKVV